MTKNETCPYCSTINTINIVRSSLCLENHKMYIKSCCDCKAMWKESITIVRKIRKLGKRQKESVLKSLVVNNNWMRYDG